MAKVITVHSEKGGVGKSSLAVNLAACFASQKRKVVVIDLDGERSATKGFGVNADKTIYDALSTGEVFPTPSEFSVDLVAGDSGVFLQPEAQKIDCLKKVIGKLRDLYDFIVIDTAPSLTPINISAYCESDYLLVASLYEVGALDGVRGVQDNLAQLRENFGCHAELLGVSLQRYNSRRNIHKVLFKLYKDEFDDSLFKTIIPECTAVSESFLVQEPVITYSPKCKATEAYFALTKEIIKRMK